MFIWSDPSRPAPKPKVSGANGSSYRKAVVIKHSPTPAYTASLEEDWLQQQKIISRDGTSLSRVSERLGERVYDVVTVTNENGEAKVFYFDVSRSNFELIPPNGKDSIQRSAPTMNRMSGKPIARSLNAISG